MVDVGLPDNLFGIQTLLLGLACYIYGSIPFAYLFTYLFTREKLTEKGTGNIGIANTFGVAGLKAGFLTVAGEATKVVMPIVLSHYYYNGSLVISLIFIFFSILGTGYSIFLKGKGGQGTTILLWALLLLSPYTFLLYIGIFLLTFITLKRRYYATIIGYTLLPVEIFLIERDMSFVIFGVLSALYYSLRYKPQKSDYAFYSENMRLLKFIERHFIKKNRLLVDISQAGNSSWVGQKAKSLWYLKKIGAQIPKTYVCTFSAYDEYISGNQDIQKALETELEKVIDIEKSYSIRSSANLEDHIDHSFAGQFDSYLHIKSINEIFEAIVSIWESVKGERVKSYLERIGIPWGDLKMAVIIQEMITADFSGVIFTKNPITSLDEVIVEAVAGTGISILQEGNTPNRWVYKWGNLIEEPQNGGLSSAVINEIVVRSNKISKKYGAPVDLEWVYDGKQIYWLQLREITTIKGINIYSNRIAKGFMPGIIKPLVWSVNIPVVNTSWKRLFIELIGSKAKSINIHSLAKSFYYRAYFNMGVIGDIFELLGMPRELIEILLVYKDTGNERPKFKPGLKTIKYIPRILLFVLNKLFISRKLERLLIARRIEYEKFAGANLDILGKSDTIRSIDHLFRINENTSYYVIVSQLLMGFYNAVLGRLLSRKKVALDDVDFSEVKDVIKDIDPISELEHLHSIYSSLSGELKDVISKLGYRGLSEFTGINDFYTQVGNFLSRFGHLSDSGNDFSEPQWKENPELVIQMIINYGQTYHHERTSKKEELGNGKLVKPRGLFISFFYRNAVRFRIYREKVNFLYVYGYGFFRPYFLHLAELFKVKGYIYDTSDIFYLTYEEMQNIVDLEMMPAEYKTNIEQRKQQTLQWQEINLPETIIGDEVPLPLAANQEVRVLKGVAASKGSCQGRVKKVRGIKDFPSVKDGDILVIPHSDISWTPVFSKAKAVVSESGGILSHCAIVAREYKIPAVVLVSHALQIPDNTLVVVDGYKGEVVILNKEEYSE